MFLLRRLSISCFSFLALIFLSPALVGQDTTNPKNQYPYAVLNSYDIDLGEIEKGSRAEGSIAISNQGAHPFIISKVRSACGLMIPTWPAAPVEPGEKTTISFRYDTSRPGPFERIITIHTNAWQKNLEVKVKGKVVPEKFKKAG